MLNYKQEQPIIYYVTADYPPDNNAGAARAKAIIEGLSEHTNVIALTHKNASTDKVVKVVRLPVRNPQSNKRLVQRTMREFLFGLFAYCKLLFAPKNSIVVVSSPPFLFLLLYMFLPLNRSTLRVLDVRDLYPDVFAQAGLISETSLLFRILSAIEARAYKKSDLILTVCDTLAEKIRERSSGDKVRLVMNGYGDAFQFQDRQPDIPRDAKPITIIAHGNFGRFQDVDLINCLVRETVHLPINYRFIGFGVNFDKIKIQANVQVEKAVPHAQIPAIVAEADLGLSVRTNDSIGRNAIPLKVLEYIGSGLPSVVVPVMADLKDLESIGAIRQFESAQLPELVSFLSAVTTNSQEYISMCKSVKKIHRSYSRKRQVEFAVKFIFQAYCDKLGKS